MEDQNIRSLYATAEKQRLVIESSPSSNTDSYRETLDSAIKSYEKCRQLSDRLSLFSDNETIEDVSSGDLQYLLINYRIAELMLRISDFDRKIVLMKAREAFERFLSLLDHYEIFTAAEKKTLKLYNEDPEKFSTISTNDPTARRAAKIANFKFEKELKQKMEFLSQNPAYLQRDDDAIRELQLTSLHLYTHHTFQNLEVMNRELEVLAMAPPMPPGGPERLERDYRERMGIQAEQNSERLDRPISEILGNQSGPILSRDGKPMRPFTLLDNRQQVQQGVFRSGHNLPTMTVDEYLEEERRRGGIIEGGGEASGRSPTPDEDNYEKADAEVMKARNWDEYVEANPKGAGNTMNRG